MPTVKEEAKKLAFKNGTFDESKKLGTGAFEVEDERDADYPVSEYLADLEIDYSQKRKFWFSNGWWGDQKDTPQCVGYSWSHWLDAGPDRKSFYSQDERDVTIDSPIDPERVYNGAQRLDHTPGENYPGTSVRAGAKYMKEYGFIDEYRWSSDIDEIVTCLLSVGSMVCRTRWYEKMYYPNDEGVINVDMSDNLSFGHAFILTGVDLVNEYIQIKNSWGRSWGINGYAVVDIADLERLLEGNRWSSCCLPI